MGAIPCTRPDPGPGLHFSAALSPEVIQRITVNRRTFLASTTAMALQTAKAAPAQIPIIDCHIHLFDTTRPQGVPWPDKKDTVLYKPASMERYRKLVAGLGIVGA